MERNALKYSLMMFIILALTILGGGILIGELLIIPKTWGLWGLACLLLTLVVESAVMARILEALRPWFIK